MWLRSGLPLTPSSVLNFLTLLVLFLYVQVREAANVSLQEIYRHVGEKLVKDLKSKGLSQQRYDSKPQFYTSFK